MARSGLVDEILMLEQVCHSSELEEEGFVKSFKGVITEQCLRIIEMSKNQDVVESIGRRVKLDRFYKTVAKIERMLGEISPDLPE